MKIEDILLENDTLKEVDGLKPEERLGSRIASWFKKKVTSDPIADKFKASAARNELDALDSRIASAAGEGDPTTSAVAKTKKAPTPMDAGEFTGTPVAKTKKAPTPMDAGEFAGTPVAKTKKAPTPMDAGEFAGTPVAKTDREAFKDPSVMRDTVKIGQPERARGARGQDMTRADAVAQADAKFKTNTPVAKTSKYPKGDIRNLGKYIKSVDRAPSAENPRTAPASWKGQGDKPGQSKYAYGDLRNLLKLAGVNRPDGSAKDNK